MVGQIECETLVQSVVVALKSCPTSISGDNTFLCTLLIQINIDVVSKNITGRPFLSITYSKKVVQKKMKQTVALLQQVFHSYLKQLMPKFHRKNVRTCHKVSSMVNKKF